MNQTIRTSLPAFGLRATCAGHLAVRRERCDSTPPPLHRHPPPPHAREGGATSGKHDQIGLRHECVRGLRNTEHCRASNQVSIEHYSNKFPGFCLFLRWRCAGEQSDKHEAQSTNANQTCSNKRPQAWLTCDAAPRARRPIVANATSAEPPGNNAPNREMGRLKAMPRRKAAARQAASCRPRGPNGDMVAVGCISTPCAREATKRRPRQRRGES